MGGNVADLDDPCALNLEATPSKSSMPAGITRHEANFSNILFHLIIAVLTQYIFI